MITPWFRSAIFSFLSTFSTMANYDNQQFWPPAHRGCGFSSRNKKKRAQHCGKFSTWNENLQHLPDFCKPQWEALQCQWQDLNEERRRFHKEQAKFEKEQFDFCIQQIQAMNQSLLAQCDLQLREWSLCCQNCWTEPLSKETSSTSEVCLLLPHQQKSSRSSTILDPIHEGIEQSDEDATKHDDHLSNATQWIQKLLNGCRRRFF